MTPARKVNGLNGLQQAFDEVRFGAERTLNLRESFPTSSEAARRVDSWLRQQQVQQSAELLIITGRGNNSENGVSVVREATIRVLSELRRKGVVREFAEHTAGSFVVTLAPMKAMLDAATQRRTPEVLPPPATPPTLTELDENTRRHLRTLAERSLDSLGVHERGPFVESEMLRLFGTLAASTDNGPDREAQLRAAIDRAMNEFD